MVETIHRFLSQLSGLLARSAWVVMRPLQKGFNVLKFYAVVLPVLAVVIAVATVTIFRSFGQASETIENCMDNVNTCTLLNK